MCETCWDTKKIVVNHRANITRPCHCAEEQLTITVAVKSIKFIRTNADGKMELHFDRDKTVFQNTAGREIVLCPE